MNAIIILAGNTLKSLIRKKDFYVFVIMFAVLFVFLLSQSFLGITEVSRFIKDVGFNCVWFFSLIIAITFSAKQIPEEIQTKTIYPLLSKPVSRWHLICGRFLGSLFAAAFSYTIFFIINLVLIYFRGGLDNMVLIFQSYIFAVLFLSLICGLSILFSLIMTYSAAVSFIFLLYFFIMFLADPLRLFLINGHSPLKTVGLLGFYAIPHLEFYNLNMRIVHGWEAVPGWVFFSVIVYTLIYLSLLLFVSYQILRKRIF